MSIASLLSQRAPITWASIGKRALRQEDHRKEDEARRQKVHRRYEYQGLDSMKAMTNSGRNRLYSLKAAFRYFFEHSEVRLGDMQKRLIDAITVAFLKNMFADDLVPNLKWLCKEFRIKELIDTLCCLVPRRCIIHLHHSLSLSLSYPLLLT